MRNYGRKERGKEANDEGVREGEGKQERNRKECQKKKKIRCKERKGVEKRLGWRGCV